MKRLRLRQFLRKTNGAAIVEFALVIPILFMMVWGIFSFTRAYQRLNALTSSLREGARAASTLDSVRTVANRGDGVKAKMVTFSSAFGYTVDTSRVTISTTATDVTVSVTNYPIFTGINFIGNLQNITVTRQAIFRCERNCND